MRRIVCDVGVVVSALLSAAGPPARILELWRRGALDLIVSELWLAELERVLSRPAIDTSLPPGVCSELLFALRSFGVSVTDPRPQAGLTPDPGDDYLVSLARAARADCLVSGDRHLTELVDPDPPVLTPRRFLDLLDPGA